MMRKKKFGKMVKRILDSIIRLRQVARSTFPNTVTKNKRPLNACVNRGNERGQFDLRELMWGPLKRMRETSKTFYCKKAGTVDMPLMCKLEKEEEKGQVRELLTIR